MNWAFTLHNYNDQEINKIKNNIDIKFAVLGFEIAPKMKVKHIQGYIEFKDKKNFIYVCNFLARARFSKPKKNRYANIEYCKKDGNYIIIDN